MNGGHDLGGMDGLGPIIAEPEVTEPLFHHEWEKSAFALTLATAALGFWNIDIGRHARERQHPVQYLSNTYYQNWLEGTVTLLLEKGLVSADELKTGKAVSPADADVLARVLTPAKVAETLGRGGPATRDVAQPPQYEVGQKVRVINQHPIGHTRAPRYVRGHVGVITGLHGGHVFADTAAHGDPRGEHLYSVSFAATELWGDDAPKTDHVLVDLWEPHLALVG